MAKVRPSEQFEIETQEYGKYTRGDFFHKKPSYGAITDKIISPENNNLIIESDRFGKLDFSKSDEEFREKNMIFFEELEKKYNINILTDYFGNIGFYTLIQFFDEKHNEYVIPYPVFEEILHLNRPKISEEQRNEDISDKDFGESFYPEFSEYMANEFSLTIDDFRSRYNWNNGDDIDSQYHYFKIIKEKLLNGVEVSEDKLENLKKNKIIMISTFNKVLLEKQVDGPLKDFYNFDIVGENKVTIYPEDNVWCVAAENQQTIDSFLIFVENLPKYSSTGLDDWVEAVKKFNSQFTIREYGENLEEDKDSDENIINHEATLEMFESTLLNSPSNSLHDGSAGASESYTRFTIIDEDGTEFQLSEAETKSSNYAHSNRVETETSSAISQILEYLYSHEETSIKSIKFEKHDSSNWGQDYDYTNDYFKEFDYSEIKKSIFEAALKTVEGANEDDIIANIAVKHIEKIEKEYFEKMKLKFEEVLSRKAQANGHNGSLGENEYKETIKLIYENGEEIELDTEGEYGSNYAHTETKTYEAENTIIQMQKIISEKGNPKTIYFSVKDENTWQGQLQKNDFSEIVFDFKEIEKLII